MLDGSGSGVVVFQNGNWDDNWVKLQSVALVPLNAAVKTCILDLS